jgi:hypothetical protein
MGIGMRPERFVHSDGAKGWMEWNGSNLGEIIGRRSLHARDQDVCVSIYLLIDSFLSYIYIYLYRSITAIVGVLDLDVCGRCRAMAWLRRVALYFARPRRNGNGSRRDESIGSTRIQSKPTGTSPCASNSHTPFVLQTKQHSLGDHESIHPSILEDQTNEPMHQPQTTC